MSQELTCLCSVRNVTTQTVFCPEPAHSNPTFTTNFLRWMWMFCFHWSSTWQLRGKGIWGYNSKNS